MPLLLVVKHLQQPENVHKFDQLGQTGWFEVALEI